MMWHSALTRAFDRLHEANSAHSQLLLQVLNLANTHTVLSRTCPLQANSSLNHLVHAIANTLQLFVVAEQGKRVDIAIADMTKVACGDVPGFEILGRLPDQCWEFGDGNAGDQPQSNKPSASPPTTHPSSTLSRRLSAPLHSTMPLYALATSRLLPCPSWRTRNWHRRVSCKRLGHFSTRRPSARRIYWLDMAMDQDCDMTHPWNLKNKESTSLYCLPARPPWLMAFIVRASKNSTHSAISMYVEIAPAYRLTDWEPRVNTWSVSMAYTFQ